VAAEARAEGRDDVLRRFTPRLTAVVPPDWHAIESLELVRTEPAAHVHVTWQLLSAPLDLRQYADAYADGLKALPGYAETSLERVELFSGRETLVRRIRWTGSPPDRTVVQTQAHCVDGLQAFTATATLDAEAAAQLDGQLMEILRGIEISRLELPQPSWVMRLNADQRSSGYEAVERGEAVVTLANGAPQPGGWGRVRDAWRQSLDELE
jgi:hypothetical protein